MFFGLAIAAGLYVLADTLNLYLTFLTLRYFAGISILIFVIIFQNEIRKYFEFLGLIGSRQIKVRRLPSQILSIQEIIQTAVSLAQEKVGALIVIQGRDNLDNFIEGGIAIDAIISEELLASIFDPHSDGHDGAVIISNNRITKFGAHLPLSTNFKALGKHGTRHSAALGLAENTDAFCIVVSEEKGKISICREGKINTLSQFSDLEKHLNKFMREKFSHSSENIFWYLFKHNLGLKMVSGLFAILIWYLIAFQTGITDNTYSVPISLTEVPENIVVDSYSPKELNITVSGRGESAFSGVDTESFKISIPVENLGNGINQVSIARKDITIPNKLSFKSIEPKTILFSVTKYNSHDVPVVANITNTPRGPEVKEIVVTPDTVGIWVPEGRPSPQEITTETIDISRIEESVIMPVKLVIPDNMRLVNGEGTVNVAITIE